MSPTINLPRTHSCHSGKESHKDAVEENKEYFAIRQRALSPLLSVTTREEDDVTEYNGQVEEELGRDFRELSVRFSGISSVDESDRQHSSRHDMYWFAKPGHSKHYFSQPHDPHKSESNITGILTNRSSHITIVEIDDRYEFDRAIFGDITKVSALRQVAIGGIAGWVAAICYREGIYRISFTIGTSLVLLQLMVYNEMISIDWTRVQRVMTMAKLKIVQALEDHEQNKRPYSHHLKMLYHENWFLGLGFSIVFLYEVIF